MREPARGFTPLRHVAHVVDLRHVAHHAANAAVDGKDGGELWYEHHHPVAVLAVLELVGHEAAHVVMAVVGGAEQPG